MRAVNNCPKLFFGEVLFYFDFSSYFISFTFIKVYHTFLFVTNKRIHVLRLLTCTDSF